MPKDSYLEVDPGSKPGLPNSGREAPGKLRITGGPWGEGVLIDRNWVVSQRLSFEKLPGESGALTLEI